MHFATHPKKFLLLFLSLSLSHFIHSSFTIFFFVRVFSLIETTDSDSHILYFSFQLAESTRLFSSRLRQPQLSPYFPRVSSLSLHKTLLLYLSIPSISNSGSSSFTFLKRFTTSIFLKFIQTRLFDDSEVKRKKNTTPIWNHLSHGNGSF